MKTGEIEEVSLLALVGSLADKSNFILGHKKVDDLWPAYTHLLLPLLMHPLAHRTIHLPAKHPFIIELDTLTRAFFLNPLTPDKLLADILHKSPYYQELYRRTARSEVFQVAFSGDMAQAISYRLRFELQILGFDG